ncbi:cellulose biosynthesis cyclic di-GMP-binding regulatory protein BcsB [Wenxinia marina]|uniref:Cyclic di-GMP-binding protein n=1 Tax=Wenxinia marina DSM 24838 TaxID=1123501 RepID=A0A0D0NLG3_9RHOB|nr:cellulose biosynthesis cyclic di-GMP-binding regulatory protein BcsB [Wenxinia marina]KIQ69135.1 Bacterial cellulose synthase subunit [Wenxinia marina DSM 24838]GGL70566.1 cellulose synthase [Wenxinia marina]
MIRRWLPPLLVGAVVMSPVARAQETADEPVIDLSPLLGLEGVQPTDEAEDPAAPADEIDAVLPDYSRRAPGDAAADAAAGEEPDAAEAPEPEPQVLFPAVANGGFGIQRMSGEHARMELRVIVPPGADVEALTVSYRNSINVLTAESQITAILNGVEIGSWAPNAFAGFETVSLPTDELRSGSNELILLGDHRHRIFCGPDATFEVWTEVDTAGTGVTLDLGQLSAQSQSLADTLLAQLSSGGGVPLVAAGTPDPALVAELRRRIGGLMPGLLPDLPVESAYTPAGETPSLARVAIVPDTEGPPVEVRRTPEGGLVLVVEEGAEPSALDTFLPLPEARTGPTLVDPGQPASLDDLGSGAIEMRERYERVDVDFRLPRDWLLMSSQKAQIDLTYGYAADLPEGSLLLVKVNDTTVRLLPLFGQGGEVLPTLPIGFPARLLSPGMNRLSFEAVVPGDPPDLPCPPVDGPILAISGDSSLSVPPSPRMRRIDMGPTLYELGSGTIEAVPGVAENSRAAAVDARLATLATPYRLDADAGDGPAPSLVIADLTRLDDVPLGAVGLDRMRLETALGVARPDLEEDIAEGSTVWSLSRLSDAARTLWQRIAGIARPGDPPLDRWLSDRQGTALLVMPRPDVPEELVLILGQRADPATVAAAVEKGRTDPDGPGGQAALLNADGTWETWQPAGVAPVLEEPLTIRNARIVAGNYASWSPFIYVALLTVLVSISVLLGLIFVVRTRESRNR